MSTHLALLNAIDHAVIATDAAGRITHWSDAAERLYSWKADEVRGREIVDVTPADISRDEAASIMKSLAEGSIWSGVFSVRDRYDRQFRVAVTDLPILEGHKVVGVVGVSFPDENRSPLRLLLERFASSAARVWPSQIEACISDLNDAAAYVSDPHVLQLLALLMMREAAALDAGEQVRIVASPATTSTQMSSGLVRASGTFAHIRFLRSGAADLGETIRRSDQSHYAAMLVNRAGGRLYTGSTPDAPSSAHLLLPTGI